MGLNRLITPHGDLKPTPVVILLSPTHYRHGVETGVKLRDLEVSSHYPSWGFETAWANGGRTRREYGLGSHYPSWGFETALPDGSLLRRLITRSSIWILITPHGDLKPLRALKPVDASHHPASHYPSWGFETLWSSPGNLRANRLLITPHGDLKLQHGSDVGRTRSETDLITPHGDLKLWSLVLLPPRMGLDWR